MAENLSISGVSFSGGNQSGPPPLPHAKGTTGEGGASQGVARLRVDSIGSRGELNEITDGLSAPSSPARGATVLGIAGAPDDVPGAYLVPGATTTNGEAEVQVEHIGLTPRAESARVSTP